MDRLERALSGLSSQGELTKLTNRLAQVLAHASKRGRVAYFEVERMTKDDTEDVLLLGNEWGLIFPVRTLKSAAWEDRLLLFEPGEEYEIPNIIRYLVEEAKITGHWNPEYAITKLFREMGEPDWERMSKLVEELRKQSKDCRITAVQINAICSELGLGNRVDALIAELKASGVMSPRLGSLAEVSRAGTPIYELNPSLFIKKGERE
jgi:uncharacterized Zn finger protein